jgi:hypothetical protein
MYQGGPEGNNRQQDLNYVGLLHFISKLLIFVVSDGELLPRKKAYPKGRQTGPVGFFELEGGRDTSYQNVILLLN